MISVDKYLEVFINNDINFFTGVPDSLLKNFVSYVASKLSSKNHVITCNEGASIALATGYHIGTNKIPLVYMQNSGLGNATNPLLSLASEKVYNIPMLLLIGWRGEPNVMDEPQHVMQGEATINMLNAMQIPHIIIDNNEEKSIKETKYIINEIKRSGKPHAIVVKNNTFGPNGLKTKTTNNFKMSREESMKVIVDSLRKNDIVVSTTGKLSRELFEYRAEKQQGHNNDFLTVGSMGHASMIALGIARENKNRLVVCFDGDGAVLMHAGNLSNIGDSGLSNYKHIVFNNGAHESVGCQETLAFKIDLVKMAVSNGYSKVCSVETRDELINILPDFFKHNKGVAFLEVKINLNSRNDLGRPTKTPMENKLSLMNNILSNEN